MPEPTRLIDRNENPRGLRPQSSERDAAGTRRAEPDLFIYAGDDVVRFGPGANSWANVAANLKFGLAGVIGNDCLPAAATAFGQEKCHDLHDSPLVIGDKAIIGLRGAPADEGTPRGFTLYTKAQADKHLRRQMAQVGTRDVLLVSHTPPHGILDVALRFGLGNIGSTAVHDFLMRTPSVRGVVCGHAHLSGGKSEFVDGKLILNIASHDHASAPMRYAVMEWNGPSLQVLELQDEEASGCGLPSRMRGAASMKKLAALGVDSTASLLAASDDDLLATKISTTTIRRPRAQARAFLAKVPVVVDPETISDNAIIIDTEFSMDRKDDPFLITVKNLRSHETVQFEELNVRKHRKHLARLHDLIDRANPEKLLMWGTCDRGALERAFRKAGLDSPGWLEKKRWINVGAWVKRVVALPVRRMDLKTVSAYLGYRYSGPPLDGLTVGIEFARYRDLGIPFDIEAVRTYNRDDVLATEHVIRQIRSLENENATLREAELGKKKARLGTRSTALGTKKSGSTPQENYAVALAQRVANGLMSESACNRAIERYSAAMANR